MDSPLFATAPNDAADYIDPTVGWLLRYEEHDESGTATGRGARTARRADGRCSAARGRRDAQAVRRWPRHLQSQTRLESRLDDERCKLNSH